jgi:protein involved in polysaccharide export with SLBB domain
MQTVLRLFFVPLLMLLLAIGSAEAASVGKIETNPFWTTMPSTTSQDASTSLLSPMTKDDQMIRVLEEREQLQELQSPQDAALKGMQDNDLIKSMGGSGKQNSGKPSVVVRGEPGDGLIKLSWKPIDMPPRIDNEPLRFTIRYGNESEKLTKSVMVGVGTDFILRELKNFQPYFIQVIALDREQQTLFKSDEIRVIPLPADEQGSLIEKSFAKKSSTLLEKTEAEPMRRELTQFGYDFFKNSLQLTSAIDAMPAATAYQLGPGDVLDLNVWGAVNFRYELTVSRNGEVTIPKVGPVRVWGLPFDKAQAAVKEALSRSYRNYEMSLTLGKLRSIQVYVVGEVEEPGNYPVSSLATVINALAAAGGPSRNGSLRAIRVTRGDQAVATVDLYDMLLSGDRNKDVQLQNGDTIFVPVIGPVVAVAGEVRRPAIYELNGKTTLPEILQMAGGVAASGSLARIQIERIENNSARIALDYRLKSGDLTAELGSVEVKDRDMVKVFPVQAAVRQVVALKGNVQQSGEYQFRPGMRLSDLIPSTQALLPESYLDSVEITRMSPPDYRRELITVSLRRALEGNQGDNLLLQEQDTVKIFSRWEMEEKPRVAVNGAVVNPGTYDYYPGMSVRDLVTAAGSAKRNAFLDQAELSRIVISGDKAQSARVQLDLGRALAGDPAHNLPLQTDDVLIVRGVTDWQEATDKFVTLKGEVRFPGVYSLARGEKLSSVISRAGGYTDRAYLRGAKFTRRSVMELQQKRMDEILIKTERDIMQKQATLASVATSREELDATKATLDTLQKNIEKLKLLKAEGRVVINLQTEQDTKSSEYDLILEGGDILDVPARSSVVNVLGHVYNPSSFVHLQGKDTGWYLEKTGGPVAEADESEMYVLQADGSVYSRQQSFFGGGFLSKTMEPGDTLVVPQKLERIAWMREIKDITQILANVGIVVGTILLGLR